MTALSMMSWGTPFLGASAPLARTATRRLPAVSATRIRSPGSGPSSPAAEVEPLTSSVDAQPGWAEGRFIGVKPGLVPAAPVRGPAFVDEETLRERAAFPIPEADLIELAKAYLNDDFGCNSPGLPRMASDFRFVAPVVPAEGKGLSGEQLCKALGQFKLEDAMPDLEPQQYDFRTDPFEPNRVWFTARGRGTNTGPVFGFLPATGKQYVGPPQTNSLTFNELGEVTKMTIGYVMDKEVGNSGGLGGIFGILYSIGYGFPVPEAQPWKPTPAYALLFRTGNLLRPISKLFR